MKIFALNTLEIGLNTLDLIRQEVDIYGIIGLSEEKVSSAISGYINQKEYCKKHNINFIEVNDYALSSEGVKDRLLQQPIDLLIVCGWQRLIPPWLIDHCKVAVVGVHGSPWGITKGRGRSPQNWALILGKSEFEISIFKIDANVDSGDIIDTRFFTIEDSDDIRLLNHKSSFLVADMIINLFKKGNLRFNTHLKQTEDAEYLPQRLPDDGEIDWSRTVYEILNFIRALSRPYPGAFSRIGDGKVYFWKAVSFAVKYDFRKYEIGEIVHVFETGELLIRAGDGFLLITDFHASLPILNDLIKDGSVFDGCNYREQIQVIISRHKLKYPNQPINREIMELVRND